MRKVVGFLNEFHWRQALLAGPAMFAVVIYGLASGRVTDAAIAAGAALSVGMVAGRPLGYFRWDSVLLVTLGTAIMSTLGSLAGEHTLIYVTGCFAVAVAVGAGSLGHPQFWLIYLQLAIAYIAGGHFPSDLPTALVHSEIVMAGGLVQLACVMILGTSIPELSRPMPSIAAHAGAVSPFKFGLVVGTVVSATILTAYELKLSNVYWPAMTSLLLLRPNLQNTMQRIAHRTVGTLIGCLIAFGIVSLAPANFLFVAVMLMTAFAITFALQPSPRTSYGWFSGAVTISILLLLDFAKTDIVTDAELRILSTILGAGFACIGALFIEYILADR